MIPNAWDAAIVVRPDPAANGRCSAPTSRVLGYGGAADEVSCGSHPPRRLAMLDA